MKKLVYLIIGACIILLVFAFLTANPESDFANPKSYNAEGSKAIFDLAERLGAQTFYGNPDESTDIAVIMQPSVEREYEDYLRDWGSNGGSLITLSARELKNNQEVTFITKNCQIPELNNLTLSDPSLRFTNSCSFITNSRYTRNGVTVNGNFFLNRHIDSEDNAKFIAILLELDSNPKIAFITDPSIESDVERPNLLNSLPGWARLALAQFLIFLAILFIHLFRRFGKPTKEKISIEIPGSRLVSGTGNLLQRAGKGPETFQVISNDLQKRIKKRYGLPQETDLDVACERLAAEINDDPRQIQRALVLENQNESTEALMARLTYLNQVDELISN